MRVLGFGTYDRARHPRIGVLLDGLAQRGYEVSELNEPMGFSTAERVAMLAGSPLRMLGRILHRWRVLVARARPLRADPPEVVVVGYLGHFDVILARMLFRRSLIVLDQLIFAADTARDRGVYSRWRLALLTLLDRLAIGCAKVIVLDTEEARGLLPAHRRPDAVVVAVGAGDEWFLPPREASDGALRVIFFGLFTPLQGATHIASALASLADQPQIHCTLVGTGQDHLRARELAGDNPQVSWLGWVEPDQLPSLVAAHDVCLGILGTTAKAGRVVPTKVYQGAAAGCAIITSDTAAQRRALGDSALYVAPGDSPALAAALRGLAADPALLATYRDRARATAQAFRPVEVIAPLAARLGSLSQGGSGR